MPHTSETAPFFNLAHARWVVGVLNMLIAVVGKDSLLGLILGQTRSEIASLVRNPAAASCENN
jgi:hypothetical protein